MPRRLRAFLGLLIFSSLSACDAGPGASKASVAAQGGGSSVVDEAGTGDSSDKAVGVASAAAGSGGESKAARAGTDAAGMSAEPAKHNQPAAGAGGSSSAGASAAGRAGAGHNEAAGQGGGGAAGSQTQPLAGEGGVGGSPAQSPVAGAAGQEAGGQGGDAAGVSAPPLCTGAKPSDSAFGASPEALDARSAGVGAPEARTNPGALAPRYHLVDFQPMSCGYHAAYGLDTFQGRPTVVALFASWCPYCREQVGKLQQLQLELEDEGKSVHIVVLNAADKYGSVDHDAIANQYELVNRVTYPLLQDTDAVDAWALHGGIKDDLLIYRSDGTLQIYLPKYMGTIPSDLTTAEGYAAVKDLLTGTP